MMGEERREERTSKLKSLIMSPVEIFAYCATLIAWIGLGISGLIDIFNLFNEGSLLCKNSFS